jgi:predicted nucleic acid-binding protein
MRDYLIDTNIWSYWFDTTKEPFHSNVLNCINKIKQEDSRLWISVITWGEIEYGYNIVADRSLETRFRQFVNSQSPIVFDIDKHVTGAYGGIRATLFERFNQKKKIKWPEQLIDPVTAKELGIQENDLWIVAQAVTRELALVTNDKKLIRAMKEILGNKLVIENWADPQKD